MTCGPAEGAKAGGSGGYEVAEEEVFENEVFVPLKGWSVPNARGPADWDHYNRGRANNAGSSPAFPQVRRGCKAI